MSDIKQEVQQFYNSVGWTLVGEDIYQNARYEDLRPVSREYITRCHQRITKVLNRKGKYLLDAGSGPVQYPAYLEYSDHYQYRVCADISITALAEARNRLDDHGLYVVCDIADLPFNDNVFDGIVSLHTIHHLPEDEHLQAYLSLYRVLANNSKAAIVNGWQDSKILNASEPAIRLAQRIRHFFEKKDRKNIQKNGNSNIKDEPRIKKNKLIGNKNPKGTFTSRHDVLWIKKEVGSFMDTEILVWRSVSVRFLRALIHPTLGGKFWLKLLYSLEEKYPHYFGENGKYPLIVISK
jgi:SAM-dependent methyltransferase